MKNTNEQVLAVATLTATAAAFEAATKNFIALFPQTHTAKFKIQNAAKAIEQVRKLSHTSHKITLKESKTLKKETFGAGGLIYNFLQLASLVPDSKIDEFNEIVEGLIEPLTEGVQSIIKHD